jgi:SAM-dependent methyltransferase
MVSEEYERMANVEDTMWWYYGLHSIVIGAMRRTGMALPNVLDAGCGTGGTLKAIAREFPNANLHGLDISGQACHFTHTKTGAAVSKGSVVSLPYAEKSFDVLVSCDVLEYPMNVNAAVAESYRVLRPGGIYVINLAAYQWLYSYHDKAVGQVRRYTRTEASALFREHGFEIVHSTYWNTLLFPLMVLRRKVFKTPLGSDVIPFNPILNRIFKTFLKLEMSFIASVCSIPFGGSVFIVCRRPAM